MPQDLHAKPAASRVEPGPRAPRQIPQGFGNSLTDRRSSVGMRWDRGTAFGALLALLLLLGLLAGLDAARRNTAAEAQWSANRALARWFVLTDPCLFTEARYTRHPSLADRHSPFQDYPLALEHFPSGSLVAPPLHLVEESGGTASGMGAEP